MMRSRLVGSSSGLLETGGVTTVGNHTPEQGLEGNLVRWSFPSTA